MAVTGKYSSTSLPEEQDKHLLINRATKASMGGVTLMERILKGICERNDEQSLLERYLKLKVRYFNQTSKDLLGYFLHVKNYQYKSVDEIFSCTYKKNSQKEFIHIIKLFIAGEFDAVHTVRMLERYYLRHKPSIVRVFAGQRYGKLKLFIDVFKTNCIKDIMQENVGFIEYNQTLDLETKPSQQQYQSLFPQRVTMASPNHAATITSKDQRQHCSLFKESIVVS